MSISPEFWKQKKLEELTLEEWEALCDRCGRCCLHKFDDDNGKIHYTNIVCKEYDLEKCQCSNYENRSKIIKDCVHLTPEKTYNFHWLPSTCSYRLIAENKPLPDWHYLISGNFDLMHELYMGIKYFAVSENNIDYEEIEEFIIDED
jgi:uncharacterized cysteine cluster protein YcgN (CxxCxxCC family)